MSTQDNGTIRKFETGATRDTATNKNDYEGFLSPLVLEAFGDYMTENRKQSDGSIRDSDNWQKGIPQAVYMKSAFRHFMQWWKLHRGLACKDEKGNPVDFNHAICGLLFNVMGYLHEQLKPKTIVEACPPFEKIVRSITYPKFFYRKPPGSNGCIYVICSEAVGRSWFPATKDWGTCTWSLEEMTSSWADGHYPNEISEEEAYKRSVPNFSLWPQQLKHALNPPASQYLHGVRI